MRDTKIFIPQTSDNIITYLWGKIKVIFRVREPQIKVKECNYCYRTNCGINNQFHDNLFDIFREATTVGTLIIDFKGKIIKYVHDNVVFSSCSLESLNEPRKINYFNECAFELVEQGKIDAINELNKSLFRVQPLDLESHRIEIIYSDSLDDLKFYAVSRYPI